MNEDFEISIIARANSLRAAIDSHRRQANEQAAELNRMRKKCPWAFDDAGDPLPDERPRAGGRQV